MPALPDSDRALLLAFRAWRVPEAEIPWSRLAPAWSAGLKSAWVRDFAAIDPEQAWSSLKRRHVAEAVFDLEHVHPSWLVRALQAESPPVVRAIVARSPQSLRDRLASALALDAHALIPDGPAHDEAVAWAQSFWAERLVGGPPLNEHDPPVIEAIAGLTPKSLARSVRTVGQIKLALAGEADPKSLRTTLAQSPDAAMDLWTRLAREDREATLRHGRASARNLGLLTIARLLGRAEPIRARWALQHLPYPIAKTLRGEATADDDRISYETRLLRAARQHLEGRGRAGRGEEVSA